MSNYEEDNYINLLKDVMENGTDLDDRTGVGTKRLFGQTLRFDLRDQFPLLTTKKVFWKGVVHELLWFLSGDTNSNTLSQSGVKIWDANAEDYAKKMGLSEVGELGPVYGHQWRKFNGDSVKGDQITNVINQIKENPNSRRLIVSAWNPLQVDDVALPPCHAMFQFGVEDGKYLTCCLYQRSCDLFLGVPFNIASYSLLTYMVAQVTGLIPKEFIWFGFDCHVYKNHFDQVKEQASRHSFSFPKLILNDEITNIYDFKFDDFKIEGYSSHPSIKADMAV